MGTGLAKPVPYQYVEKLSLRPNHKMWKQLFAFLTIVSLSMKVQQHPPLGYVLSNRSRPSHKELRPTPHVPPSFDKAGDLEDTWFSAALAVDRAKKLNLGRYTLWTGALQSEVVLTRGLMIVVI